MAKILICGLGGGKNKETGSYNKATYSITENTLEKIYKDKYFISSALEEHYNIDKTIYIGTTGSMWDSLYSYYCEKFNVEPNNNYLEYLEKTIKIATKDTSKDEIDLSIFEKTFKEKVKIKIVNYGVDRIEIFENFNIIMEVLDIIEDGDEIFLDITHSFRSSALWMFLVLNYLTDVTDKNVVIKKISYGMFELRNEQQVSPIVDLTAFYELTQWIKAAHDFKNYGNSYKMLELMTAREITRRFKTFSDVLNINYVGNLKKNLEAIKKISSKIDNLQGPEKLILPKVTQDFIKTFDNIEREDILFARLAKWHFKYKRYALSYINIDESIRASIKEMIIRHENINVEELEQSKKLQANLRNRISIILSMGKKVYKKNPRDKDAIKFDALVDMCEILRSKRNKICHSIVSDEDPTKDIEILKEKLDEIEELLEDTSFLDQVQIKFDILKKNTRV